MKGLYSLKPRINALELHNILLDNELIEAAQTVNEAKKEHEKYVETIQSQLDQLETLAETCREADSKYRQLLNKYNLDYYLEPEDALDFDYVFSVADVVSKI